MRIRCYSCLVLTMTATAAAAGLHAQSAAPLPEPSGFVQEVRRNLQTDRILQRDYAYREKRIDVRRDDRGAETGRTEKVFDVFPSPDGTDRFRRIVSINGEAPDAASVESAERLRQNAVRERQARIERETPAQRASRLRDEYEDRRKENDIIDDAFRVYDFRLTGREMLDGFETIVMTFTPAPNVAPRSSEGKILQKFSGRAWVAERSHQLMRLEMESSDDVSFGFGLLARMNKGSQVIFQRRPVDGDHAGDVWLPSELRYTGGGRVLLLKKLRLEGVREYSHYRALVRD
jgi:hypothetical protein